MIYHTDLQHFEGEEVYCHDRFRPNLTDLSHHWLYLSCRPTICSWMRI